MPSCQLSRKNNKLLELVRSSKKLLSSRLLQLPSQISKTWENTLSCGEKEVRRSTIQSGTARLSTREGQVRSPSVAVCAHSRTRTSVDYCCGVGD